MIDDVSDGIWESINERDKVLRLTISPNPASSVVQVFNEQSTVIGIDIYNTLGEKVYTLPLTDYRSPITINITALHSGMYFAEIRTSKGVEVRKFIKE